MPHSETPKPAIILVEPQLGENIGYAARAMLNFGLTDLRLVAPRDGWPNPAAGPAASGADDVLDGAGVFETLEEAIADLNHVYASTVRNRDIYKPVLTVTEASEAMHASAARGERTGILFGRERSGLSNDDIALANAILTVPVNPGFGSLNLAQAVILVAFEWSRTGVDLPAASTLEDDPIATKADLVGLFEHIEGALAPRGYFRPPARKRAMVQALRNLLQGAGFTGQQVRTLRGVIKSLTRPLGGNRKDG
ncbi:MAG: RNA methyltransferase [Proteobacteria bacterium]|nr:RNA methyltransferase [Pseudomonadota bacterium]